MDGKVKIVKCATENCYNDREFDTTNTKRTKFCLFCRTDNDEFATERQNAAEEDAVEKAADDAAQKVPAKFILGFESDGQAWGVKV